MKAFSHKPFAIYFISNSLSLLGFGCLLFGAASNFFMLALGFGFLRFFGQGSLMLCSSNIVTQWFDKKRGFALGLMGLGFAISMGLHPPISNYLIGVYGWRMAWVIIVVDHINVAINAVIEAISILVEGSNAITTPVNPKIIAVHLLQPIISFKKIIARIELKIGTAIEITVTSAMGNL